MKDQLHQKNLKGIMSKIFKKDKDDKATALQPRKSRFSGPTTKKNEEYLDADPIRLLRDQVGDHPYGHYSELLQRPEESIKSSVSSSSSESSIRKKYLRYKN